MRTLLEDITYTLRYVSLVVLGLVVPFCDSTFLEPFRVPSRSKVAVGREGEQ